MKWEAVLIVTIIALAPEFCQVVVKKLLQTSNCTETKALSSRNLAFGWMG